jgi:hypothetical protein
MKKEIILTLLVLSSCVNVEEVPPENLIGEDKMADLIFELAVLDAAKGFVPTDQKGRIELDADSFYLFHEIDSAQFTSSNAYYTKQPKAYLRIVSVAKTKLQEFNKNIEESENEMLKTDSIHIKPKQRKNLTK